MSSSSAACVNCQDHNRFGGLKAGIPEEQLDSIREYAAAPGFSDAQRAALKVAHHASLQPNQVDDENFAELHKY